MKKHGSSAIILFILLFSLFGLLDTASGQISSEDAKTLLLGEWIIAPIKGFRPGSLTVNDESHYTMTRYHDAAVGATLKGEYSFDTTREPYAIDFCLGDCDNPGAEWTTQVGILRFVSRDEIEIQFDPAGKRPQEFTPKDDDPYFARLTRKD